MFSRRPLAAFMLAILLVVPRAAAGEETSERWFVIEMMGGRAGWMHSTVRTDGEHTITTDRMHLTLDRADTPIVLDMTTEWVETAGNEPVSVRVEKTFGAEREETTYSFGADGVKEVTDRGGRVTETGHPPIEGVWLTPAGSAEYLARRIAAGADGAHYRTIDATARLEPVMMTCTGFEPATLELLGREVGATRCSVVNALTPTAVSVEYLDENGTVLRSETDIGGMHIVMTAADKELALSEADAPEMMVRSFISPGAEIPGARTLERAVYVLSVPDGAIGEIPATGSQTVEPIDGRTVRVTVDAVHLAPAGGVDAAALTAASSMLDTDDRTIRDLAARALDGVDADPARRAEAMRRFVYRYITAKSLGVGFASASAVARSREGDCSEHATLLAALLRADGIPSRVASGLVYVDEFAGERAVFGYHMWTQALLDRDGSARWVDLDATLPGAIGYDATHIALGVSALADGEAAGGLLAIAPMLGRLSVRVESLE